MSYEYFSYQSSVAHTMRRQVMYDLAKRIPCLSTGVDVGAGDNLVGDTLRLTHTVIALDLAPTMDGAVAGDCNSMPFADESLDFIVAGELLEHMETPLFTLREFARSLRPGGYLLGSVPNSGQFWDVLAMVAGGVPYQLGRKLSTPAYEHESFFTKRALADLLRSAGYDEIEIVTNLVRLWPGSDRGVPGLSPFLCRWFPRFGDRLIWIARKRD